LAMATWDPALFAYLPLWYLGNVSFNIYNKLAGRASGGAQFAFTLAVLQLAVGSAYALFLWVAPDARQKPKITFTQILKLLPLGTFTAVAHGSAIYSNLAGSLSFGQIIKSGEPVFAAAIGFFVYGSRVSRAKLLCLLPIIGGIMLASAAELDYTPASFFAMTIANVASAFRAYENKRVMASKELQAALGGVSNTFAITTIWATVVLTPAIFLAGEFKRRQAFLEAWEADGVPGGSDQHLRFNAIISGLVFYLYNEISTKSLTSLSGVSHSVANTAKRAVVVVGSALVLGERMNAATSVGCCIAIGGTFLYTVADDLASAKRR